MRLTYKTFGFFTVFFLCTLIVNANDVHAQLARLNVEHEMYVDPSRSEATLTLQYGPWRGSQLDQFSSYVYVETFCTDQSRTGNSTQYLGMNDFIRNRFESGIVQLPVVNLEEGVRVDCIVVLRSKLPHTLDHPIAISDMFSFYRSKLPNHAQLTSGYIGTLYGGSLHSTFERVFSGVLRLTKEQGRALLSGDQKLVATDGRRTRHVQWSPWTYYKEKVNGQTIPSSVHVAIPHSFAQAGDVSWRMYLRPSAEVGELRFVMHPKIRQMLREKRLQVKAYGENSDSDMVAEIDMSDFENVPKEFQGHNQITYVFNALLRPVNNNVIPAGYHGPLVKAFVTAYSGEEAGVSVDLLLANSLIAKDPATGNITASSDDFYFKELSVEMDDVTMFEHNYVDPLSNGKPVQRIGTPTKNGNHAKLNWIQRYSGIHWIKNGAFVPLHQLVISPDSRRNGVGNLARSIANTLPYVMNVMDGTHTSSVYKQPAVDGATLTPDMMSTHSLSARTNLVQTLWTRVDTWREMFYGISPNFYGYVTGEIDGHTTSNSQIYRNNIQDIIMRNSLGTGTNFVRGMESMLALFRANQLRQEWDIAFTLDGQLNSVSVMDELFQNRQQLWIVGAFTDARYSRGRGNLWRNSSNANIRNWYNNFAAAAFPQVEYNNSSLVYCTAATPPVCNPLFRSYSPVDYEHFARYARTAVPAAGIGDPVARLLAKSAGYNFEMNKSSKPGWDYYDRSLRASRSYIMANPNNGGGFDRTAETFAAYAMLLNFSPEISEIAKTNILQPIFDIQYYSQIPGLGWRFTHGRDDRDYTSTTIPTLAEVKDRFAQRHNVAPTAIAISQMYRPWHETLAEGYTDMLAESVKDDPDPVMQDGVNKWRISSENFVRDGHVIGRTLTNDPRKRTFFILTVKGYTVNGVLHQALVSDLEPLAKSDIGTAAYYNQMYGKLQNKYRHLANRLQCFLPNFLSSSANAIDPALASSYAEHQRMADEGFRPVCGP